MIFTIGECISIPWTILNNERIHCYLHPIKFVFMIGYVSDEFLAHYFS